MKDNIRYKFHGGEGCREGHLEGLLLPSSKRCAAYGAIVPRSIAILHLYRAQQLGTLLAW